MDTKGLSAMQEKLNRRMRWHFETYFSNLSLTSTQALTLEVIMMVCQEHDITPKDLEGFLEIKPSSVNSLLNGLERRGYIRRESVAYDGRLIKLVPTEKAFEMQEDISERISRYLEQLFSGISEEDLLVYESVIAQMLKNTT